MYLDSQQSIHQLPTILMPWKDSSCSYQPSTLRRQFAIKLRTLGRSKNLASFSQRKFRTPTGMLTHTRIGGGHRISPSFARHVRNCAVAKMMVKVVQAVVCILNPAALSPIIIPLHSSA